MSEPSSVLWWNIPCMPDKYKVVWGKDTVYLKYPIYTAADVLARREAFKTRFMIEWGFDTGRFKDRLVDAMFTNHIFPVVGKVNLFNTVAAFQPGR